MNINELSNEQLAALEAQLEEKKRKERENEAQERDTLKQLQHEFVEKFFPKLTEIARNLTLSKSEIFDNTADILSLKKQVYKTSDEAFEKQQTHTLSTRNFEKTIIIGYNVVDDWDSDLVSSGVDGVNKWLTGKLNDTNQDLVDMIRDLLRPNKDGILKANRVIELYKRAVKIGDSELIKHVQTIQEAYMPKKTSTFVKAKYKGENGQDIWINLSMSSA
ncbi:MAG: DUF3164 family protein [Candidatus Symbiothrix sp.]|jgi:hypothetical protein|nr:DUF3164 family protein [Candidatus Symbiothrix sp.]